MEILDNKSNEIASFFTALDELLDTIGQSLKNRTPHLNGERLILYLDTETDNVKRVRLLNMTQVEFETIKSLELSYGAKKDILKIVYSDKVLSLTNKELDLIHR